MACQLFPNAGRHRKSDMTCNGSGQFVAKTLFPLFWASFYPSLDNYPPAISPHEFKFQGPNKLFLLSFIVQLKVFMSLSAFEDTRKARASERERERGKLNPRMQRPSSFSQARLEVAGEIQASTRICLSTSPMCGREISRGEKPA